MTSAVTRAAASATAGLLLSIAPLAADPSNAAPTLAISDNGAVTLEDLPPILEDPTVARQLTTGLTVVFAVRVELEARTGKAEVDVRYELWDELFSVAVRETGLPVRRLDALDPEELAAWWQGLRLAILDPAPQPRGQGDADDNAEVKIDVLPFSRSEEAETRRWLAATVRRGAGAGASEISRSADGASESLASVVDVLIATSVRRRAIRSFNWSLETTR